MNQMLKALEVSLLKKYLIKNYCLKLNNGTIIKDINKGQYLQVLDIFKCDYKDFINILISALFLEEKDFHDGNFGFGTDNKLIKIDRFFLIMI